MSKNILITGANGQLGNEMRKVLVENPSFNVFFTDVAELDITNGGAINSFISTHKIQYIINCAAYTAVDRAEDDMVLCAKLNVDAVGYLASAARSFGVKLIHISTDYVFDGYNYHPYTEDEPTNPKSVYGTTKLDGENAIARFLSDAIIIRTAWLYSEFGNNFVKTMIRLGQTKPTINVVADQIGTPTYAGDLAHAIYTIISADEWHPGIYHFSDEGVCSWYDFAKAIHRIYGITACEISPILSQDYPTKATRPFYSVLDKTKIKSTYGIKIPYWLDSLEKCISLLKQQ